MKTLYNNPEMISEDTNSKVMANFFSLQDKKVKQSQSNRLPRCARNDVAFHNTSLRIDPISEIKQSLSSIRSLPLYALVFLLLLLLNKSGQAQQRFHSSLYNLNSYSLNTAYAGLDNCIEAYIDQKNQYIGIEGSPVNTYVQAHTRLGQNLGLGISINRWSAGLLTNNDFSLAGSYHLALNKALQLSGSVNLGYYGYQLESQDLVAFDQDVVLNQGTLNDGGLYADLGILLTHQNVEVGLAAPRLLNSTAEFEANNQYSIFDVERYLNIHGKYRHQLNEEIQVMPSAVVRTIPGDGAITDIQVGANYQNTFGLSLGYRTRNGLIAAIDYNYNNLLTIGYAYDAGMSNLNGISNGSHEILLGIKLCREEKKKEPKPEPVAEAPPVPPAPKPVYQLLANVVDENSSSISNQQVVLTNKTKGTTQELKTDDKGRIRTNLEDSTDYEISISNPNYETKTQSFNTDGINQNKELVSMLKAKIASYYGTITDAKTGEGIPQVQVNLTNANENYTATTDQAGKFSIKLRDKKLGNDLNYEVNFKKKGYASDKDTLTDKVNNFEPKDLMKVLQREAIVLKKFEEGADVAKLIDIQPIYFELGKYEINPSSAKQLDKLAKTMNENPEMEVELGAHTDCRGAADLNKRLSDKRAKAAAEYVKGKIENPERVEGKGYGEDIPLTDCKCAECSDEEHADRKSVV